MGALMFIVMMVSLIFVDAELVPTVLITSALFLIAYGIEQVANAIRKTK